ncbi:uncharacterized protein LOC101862128 [Aplysia californica]|uniref:Uncharacterized protein LOC101862128 n=1 Tax=Aplysia californica TaxID=6500 RepID=A0ABM1A4U3_APLCA|nr:uncharacterized protein LOC101862128 [Aplysia californica]
MHKLCLLSLLLAAVAVSSAQKIRLFSPTSVRSRPFNIHQFNTLQSPLGRFQGNALGMFPGSNYINLPPQLPLAYPVNRVFGGRRRLPDGEYRTAYGIASVDGSDVNMDSY